MLDSDTLAVFADVSSDGQVILPKEVRDYLGIGSGRPVALICKDNQVVMMSSARHAMDVLTERMEGKFEAAGLYTDEDVVALCKEIRREMYYEKYGVPAATETDQATALQLDRAADTVSQAAV